MTRAAPLRAVLTAAALAPLAACVPEDIPPRPLLSAAGDGGAHADVMFSSDSTNPVENVNLVWKSQGCGQPLPPETVATVPGKPTGYTHFSVMATGATLKYPIPAEAGPRTFWVRVPADYDPEHAYRVVYLGQGCGASVSANTQTYPLYNAELGGTEEAVYVAIDLPTNMVNADCYDTVSGLESQEWEAFELFHTFVESRYCVDNNRVFAAGYATGGTLADMWGCYFAGTPDPPRKFAPAFRLRGQLAVAGGEPVEQPTCGGPVAALWLVDINDYANPISTAQLALARVLSVNGCRDSQVVPWAGLPGICFQYVDCPKTHPVVFCTTSGLGHSDQGKTAVPISRTFLDTMNPKP